MPKATGVHVSAVDYNMTEIFQWAQGF